MPSVLIHDIFVYCSGRTFAVGKYWPGGLGCSFFLSLFRAAKVNTLINDLFKAVLINTKITIIAVFPTDLTYSILKRPWWVITCANLSSSWTYLFRVNLVVGLCASPTIIYVTRLHSFLSFSRERDADVQWKKITCWIILNQWRLSDSESENFIHPRGNCLC